MSSSRLRLGPVDGLDDDYDPLLGRAARESAPALPAPGDRTAPAETAPPGQEPVSVFDEPGQQDDDLAPILPLSGRDGPVASEEPAAALPPPPPPFAGEVPVRRLPTQAPGKGLFVFRNPWRTPLDADAAPVTNTPGAIQPDTAPPSGPPTAPTAEAVSEPFPLATPEAAPEADPAPSPESSLEPAAESGPVAATQEAAPEPLAADTAAPSPAPEPTPPQPADAPAMEPAVEPTVGPAGEPEPELEPTPAAEPEAAAEPEPDLPVEPEPIAAETDSANGIAAPLETVAPDQAPAPHRWPFGVGVQAAAQDRPEPAARTGAADDAGEPDVPVASGLPEAEAAPAGGIAPEAVATGAQAIDTGTSDPAPHTARGTRTAPKADRQRAPKAKSSRKPRPGQRAQRARRVIPGWILGTGTFATAASVLMTAGALAAPLGGAFTLLSDHLLYLSGLTVAGLVLWAGARVIAPAVVTALVLAAQLGMTLPSLGEGPVGGPVAKVVGWAALGGSQDALEAVMEQAEREEAGLLLLGDAPSGLAAGVPAGWTVVAAPAPGDATSITILARDAWRAANIPGEPAMARAADNSLTVIGVNPPPAEDGNRSSPLRDAEINRSAARAGVQTTPTLVVGDFEVVPWSRSLGQFTSYGNVERVRCGGLFGATRGLLAQDHAFIRDAQVARCRTGASLPGSGHRPLWLGMAPPAAADQAAAEAAP